MTFTGIHGIKYCCQRKKKEIQNQVYMNLFQGKKVFGACKQLNFWRLRPHSGACQCKFSCKESLSISCKFNIVKTGMCIEMECLVALCREWSTCPGGRGQIESYWKKSGEIACATQKLCWGGGTNEHLPTPKKNKS